MSNKEYSNRNKSYSSKDYHSNGNYSDKGCMTTIVLLFLVLVFGGWLVFSNSENGTIDKYFDSFQDKNENLKEVKKIATLTTPINITSSKTLNSNSSSKTSITTNDAIKSDSKDEIPHSSKNINIFSKSFFKHKDDKQIGKTEFVSSEKQIKNEIKKYSIEELEEKLKVLSTEYREKLLDYNRLDSHKKSLVRYEFKEYEREYRKEISIIIDEIDKQKRAKATSIEKNKKTDPILIKNEINDSYINSYEKEIIREMRKTADNIRNDLWVRYRKIEKMPENRLIEEYEIVRTIIQDKIWRYRKDRQNIFSNLLELENSLFLLLAIKKDYSKILEIVLNNGYSFEKNNVNGFPIVFYANEFGKNNCLDVLLKRKIDFTKELVPVKNYLPNRIPETKTGADGWFEGKTLLHSAAQTGNLILAQKVLEAGVSVNKRTKDGKNPLYFAVKNNRLEMVSFLVENGSEIDDDLEDLTNNKEILEILKKGNNSNISANSVDVLSKNDKEWKEAYEYIKEGKLVKLFELSKKKDLSKMIYKGEPALCLAVQYNKIEIIKFLVHEYECEKLTDIEYNRNALHYAAINSNIEIIEFLLKNGFNPNIQDKKQNTPLHYLMNDYSPSYFIYELLEKGANINALNKNKESPLFLAVKKNNYNAIKALIYKKADVNLQDCNGNTPLICAVEKSLNSLVKILLECSANPNLVNLSKKQTALHLAVLKEDIESIRLLLLYGADMNISDSEGNTPLHYVALFDSTNTEVLDLFDKYKDKFNLSIKNNDGKTPNDINEAYSFEAP